MFTAGIDLYDFPNFFPFDLNGKDEDKARLSKRLYDVIINLQKCVLSII